MPDAGCRISVLSLRGGGVRRPAFPIRILTSPEIFGGFESAGREGNQRRSRPNWIIQAVGTNPVNPVDPVSGFVHHPPATTPDLQTGLQERQDGLGFRTNPENPVDPVF